MEPYLKIKCIAVIWYKGVPVLRVIKSISKNRFQRRSGLLKKIPTNQLLIRKLLIKSNGYYRKTLVLHPKMIPCICSAVSFAVLIAKKL